MQDFLTDEEMLKLESTQPRVGNSQAPDFIPDEPAPQEPFRLPGQKFAENLAGGMGQGVLSTFTNLGKLGGSAVNAALGKGFTPSAPGGLQYNPIGQKLVEASEKPQDTLAGKFGFGVEQLAEFLVPLTKASKLPQGANLATKALNIAANSIKQALDFGTKSFIQSGGGKEETLTSVGFGLATPPAVAAIKKALPVIGDISSAILGNMIGKDPQHIKIAFQNPLEVAKNISLGIIPLEIREKAVVALKTYDSAIKDTFSKGLEALQQKTPSKFILGKYNAVKQIMKNDLQNSMSGMPQLFRDFKVSVQNKGTSLDFDRLNSAVIKPAEKSNVKMAWQTVLNQKDFSPKGTEAVAARLYALRKFGENNESSALINSIYSRYLKSIEKVYPDLAKLRAQYATEKQIIEGINEVIQATKNQVANPKAVTTATRKLSNLFQEDGEAYLKAIKTLEEKTGVSLLKELAASEFIHYAPASFGSRIAQAGLLTGGLAYNPWILAALPLFSPRFVGKATTMAGRAVPVVNKVAPLVPPTAASSVQQLQRGLEFNQ